MHEPDLRAISIGGGTERRRLQSAALFSNERWGTAPGNERLCGYSIGKLDFAEGGAKLELWPRKANRIRGGGWKIQLDQESFSIERGADQSTGQAEVQGR